MEECRILVETSSETLAEELGSQLRNFFSLPTIEPKIYYAIGKENAKKILFGDARFADIIISEIVPRELATESVHAECSFSSRRFIELTGNIETLKFAYFAKDAMPFCTFIIAADYSAFTEHQALSFIMKAKKIGVESILPLPMDKFHFERLLEAFELKSNYECWAFAPISKIFENRSKLIERC